MSEQNGLNGGKASDWLRPYAPNWALFIIVGGVQLAIIELQRMRQLRAVLAPRSVHTGGKSEAQLTKKQAVLLMHDIYLVPMIKLVDFTHVTLSYLEYLNPTYMTSLSN